MSIKPTYLIVVATVGIFLLLVTLTFAYFLQNQTEPAVESSTVPIPSLTIDSAMSESPIPTVQSTTDKIKAPVDQFRQRITKKSFGTYVTPKNSPVSPERFTGYHTGVDVEYGDVKDDVPVLAIADGKVLSAQTVNGYGGAIAVSSTINNTPYVIIYGHLDPKSFTKDKIIGSGEKLGILGDAFSDETDGERKHLHLAIIKGSAIDWRGYVQSKNELSAWIDPLSLY